MRKLSQRELNLVPQLAAGGGATADFASFLKPVSPGSSCAWGVLLCLLHWAYLLPECPFSNDPHLVTAWLQRRVQGEDLVFGGVHDALDSWFLLWRT